MATLPGRTIALFGRFQSVSRAELISAIKNRGGNIARDVNDRTKALVVGRGSISYSASDKLDAKIKLCRSLNVPVLSEREAAEAVGLRQPLGVGVPVDIVASKGQLALEEIDYLRIFDVVAIRGGQAQFRDVEKAEMVGSLLEQGKPLSEIIKAFHRIGDDQRVIVTMAPNGDLAVKWGRTHTTLSGQGILPLEAGPSISDLFEAALEAETEGDLTTAQSLYEICVNSDRKDAISAFNLGNVCLGLGQTAEAIFQFQKALHRDPQLAEAHYNLGLIAESKGELDEEADHLQEAIKANPNYPDALYNLALLEFQRGAYAAAAPLFRKFLKLEAEGDWAQRAKKALLVCDSSA